MSQPGKVYRVLISGGGTGGHIFPAVAIANKLMQQNEKFEILFVGANGRMEMQKVPAAGYKIVGLDIAGIQRSLSLKNLLLPFKLLNSLRKAGQIISDFKPDVAVGVGGYASGPTLYMATRRRIPCVVQEQNSYPGITNKLLAKRVRKICVAYEGMDKFFPKDKIVVTGNPVRQEIVRMNVSREESLAHFNLKTDKKTILVIGGSLGARTVNESIEGGLKKFSDAGVQVIWQTGKGFHERAKNAASDMENICVRDFINRMDYAYSAADIILSRAGAISISELCLVAKPCILIPSPNVSEDHQTKNAMALVKNNAAQMVMDMDARAKLPDAAIALMNDEGKRKILSDEIKKLAKPDADQQIVDEIKKLLI